jgi:AraC-like DNA-binding protein
VANAVGVPGPKEQRLQAVRDTLLAVQEPAPRIADTALRFGFTHLGEFSRHYRRAFGEVPRDTLKKRR